MSVQIQLQFSRKRPGRIILHVLAIFRAGHVHWHLAGILRELHS